MTETEGEGGADSVDLPAGDWLVLNPPGHDRWAFDLVGVGPGGRILRSPAWRVAAGLGRADQAWGWGRPVTAPFDGEVVTAHDAREDRRRLVPLLDVPASFLVRPLRHRDDVAAMAGNHVLVVSGGRCALLAHLRRGSLQVRVGEAVEAGQTLGAVGNSGNTVMPHLHLQVMDGPDPRSAIQPFAVRRYHVWDGRRWALREQAPLPAGRTRIRV